MGNRILHTEQLEVGYLSKTGNTVVASNINLSLEKGKLIALIGANGIGKSTLLRTLTGLQQPLSGKVLLNGKELSDYNAQTLAQQQSLVLTEKLPPSNLTVFELVALGRQPYTNWIGTLSEVDKAKISEALHQTQTGPLSQKKHYEISDGQLQKVMIARALAQDTPLIVLDEPTTHLDIEHKLSLFRLLKTLAHRSGKCVLFSTHDIEMAISLSDEMIIMLQGRAIQGKPADFLADGTFGKLFTNDNIGFDNEKVKFVFKNI
jgi:iron complex transport system ATP-binding protein